jgi:transcriptional regulator with XRE-family HTH domain
LILEKNCFTLKNKIELLFAWRKETGASRMERKTDAPEQHGTIANGLKRYSIGAKLRRLRLRKSMGLVELGRHTGLSPALISKLERDIMHPTLPTLLRIAMVFSVGLEYFFVPEAKPTLEIVRKKDRIRFPERPDGWPPAYFFESLEFPVSDPAVRAYFADFEAVTSAESRLHEHPGIELLYVLSGRLELFMADESHELGEGDSVYFDATAPHGYRRLSSRRTTALVVTAGGPSTQKEPGTNSGTRG